MIPEKPFNLTLLFFGLAAILFWALGSARHTPTTRTATVNILSNNRILSPDTTINVLSNNPETTGNANRIEMMPGIWGCWDGIQYRPGACE